MCRVADGAAERHTHTRGRAEAGLCLRARTRGCTRHHGLASGTQAYTPPPDK